MSASESLDPAIASAFERAGINARIDNGKAKYYRRMVMLAGDLAGMRFLRDPALLNVFNDAQARIGAVYRLNDLFALMRVGKGTARIKAAETLTALVQRQIMLRGYVIACPVCRRSRWLYPDAVSEQMRCPACAASNLLPLDATFVYKLNAVYRTGFTQGALSVLLTALYYAERASSLTWHACVIAEKGGLKTEIDLVCALDGRLILIECKDKFVYQAEADFAALRDQLARGRMLAREVGADFAFATAQPLAAVPSSIQAAMHGETLLTAEALF